MLAPPQTEWIRLLEEGLGICIYKFPQEFIGLELNPRVYLPVTGIVSQQQIYSPLPCCFARQSFTPVCLCSYFSEHLWNPMEVLSAHSELLLSLKPRCKCSKMLFHRSSLHRQASTARLIFTLRNGLQTESIIWVILRLSVSMNTQLLTITVSLNNLISIFLTYTCQLSDKWSHWESVAWAAWGCRPDHTFWCSWGQR